MSAIPCSSVSLKTMADGTLRISFDIEPMHAQDAFKLFAAPGTPAALAALTVGYEAKGTQIASTHEKPKGGPLAKLAGMWCNDPEFRKWVHSNGHYCETAGDAAEWICWVCNVDSRAKLDHDEAAAEKFHFVVRAPYNKHLIARGIVA